MRRIIFYSWQSDLPNSANRGFIQDALEKATKSIASDDSIDVEPVVDRDTLGVSGSPDIASTIFGKISASDIFVADISIIGQIKKNRFTPNPNVLIELGYALKSLGHERVILIFNEAFGKIENLPFDLKMRRLLVYNMPEKAEDRATERNNLEKKFDTAIRTALASIPTAEVNPLIPSASAIENQQANRVIVLRQDLNELFKKFEALEPPKHSEGGTPDDLINAISGTQEAVAEFSKIAEMTTVMNDVESALNICRWFGKIFERYNLPPAFSGRFSEADQDYFKFVGHELLVSLIAFMIREQRWDMIERILEEPIPLSHRPHGQGAGNEYWEYASAHLHLLLSESPKRKRMSLHADILHDRHTTGGLSAILPFEDFAAADYFLFLLDELSHEQAPELRMEWRPWSALYLNQAPTFVRNSERLKTAEQIIKVLKIPSIDEFKKRLTERGNRVSKLFRDHSSRGPITQADIDRIGSR